MTNTHHIHAEGARPVARRLAAPVLIAAVLLLCCAPAIAQAAQRFAAPSAQGSGNCSSTADACTLEKALSGAATGDELILAGDAGTYGTKTAPITTTLTQPSGVYTLDIHGATGQPRPVIYSSASIALQLLGWFDGEGFSVSDIDLEHVVNGGSALEISGSLDHVLVHSTASSDFVCNVSGLAGASVSVTDSECIADGSMGYALFEQNNGPPTGTATVALRNDTFEATGPSSLGVSVSANGGVSAEVTATNTIAHGAFKDLDAYRFGSAGVSFALNHSNYATTLPEAGTTITAPGSVTNQVTEPLFVDAASDNFHEAPGSPTIGAGVTEAANGSTDLEGDPRTTAGLTDIGAFQAPAPTPEPTGTGTTQPPQPQPSPAVAPLPTVVSSTPGVLSLHSSTATVTGGAAPLKLSCSAQSSGCRGTLLLTERERVVKKIEVRLHSRTRTRLHEQTVIRSLGSASFSIAAGQTTTLRIALSHAARAQLVHATDRRLTVAVAIERGDGGPALSTKLTLTLPASRPPRKPRRSALSRSRDGFSPRPLQVGAIG
jgi:hypothetical protein